MLTPAFVFLSFGMPPEKMPPNWGAESVTDAAEPAPISLLLRNRLTDAGAGGLKPGTGGAPPTGGPALADEAFESMMGADRSLIWVTFFSRAPFSMSPRSAPCGNIHSASALSSVESLAKLLYVLDTRVGGDIPFL